MQLNWDAIAAIPASSEVTEVLNKYASGAQYTDGTKFVNPYGQAIRVTWASLFNKASHIQLMVVVKLAFEHSNFQPLIDLPVSTELICMALANYDRMTFVYKEHLLNHTLPELVHRQNIQSDEDDDKRVAIDVKFLVEVLKHEAKYGVCEPGDHSPQLLEYLESELFPSASTVIDTVSVFRINFMSYLKAGPNQPVGVLAKKLWYAREFTLSEVKEHITTLYNPKLNWDSSESIAILAKLAKLNLARLKDLKLIAIQRAGGK
jgi:hypothetical protein